MDSNGNRIDNAVRVLYVVLVNIYIYIEMYLQLGRYQSNLTCKFNLASTRLKPVEEGRG